MSLSQIMDVVALVIVVGLGAYQIYRSVKRYMEHVKCRKEFLEINKEKLNEEFLEHKKWALAYATVAIAGYVVGIYFFVKATDFIYACACISLGLIMTGYVLDCFVTRRSWYYEDGFYFENRFYRYRSLAAVTPRKGIFPSYDVRFHAQPDMVVTRQMADKLQEKQAEWKKAKKDKKKAG